MSSKVSQIQQASRPVVFDMTSQECIWSVAGVTPYRLCHNAFDCTTCAFDRKMQRKRGPEVGGHAPTWREKARQGGGLESRRCRHMLSGYVPVKYCVHDFECATCEYDQLIAEEMRLMEAQEPMVELVAGFALAPNYYYHQSHTWGRVEYGGQVRLGLDDFAARLFGPAQELRLPELGAAVSREGSDMAFYREGREAGLVCPLEGIVVAVNPRLETSPGLANGSPYGAGWLVIIEPTRLSRDLRGLSFGRQAEQWLDAEAGRLAGILYRESGYRLAATGGRAVGDIYGSVEGLDWDELVETFLAPPA